MAVRAERLLDDGLTRTTIRVPSDLWEAVNVCASAMGTSANAVVADALIDFVSAKEHRAQVDEFFREGKDRFSALLDKVSS
jgi:predicted transcriptional regulator